MSEINDFTNSIIVNESDTKYEVYSEVNSSNRWIAKEDCPSPLEDVWLLKLAGHKRKLEEPLSCMRNEEPPSKQREIEKFLRTDLDHSENDFLTQEVDEFPSTQQLFPIPLQNDTAFDSSEESINKSSKSSFSVLDIGLPMSALQRKMMHRLVQYFAFCIDHFCTGPSDSRIQEKIRLFIQSAHNIAKHPCLYDTEVRNPSAAESTNSHVSLDASNFCSYAENSSKFLFLQELFKNLSPSYSKTFFLFISNQFLANTLTQWLKSQNIDAELWAEEDAKTSQHPAIWICVSKKAPSASHFLQSCPDLSATIFYDIEAYMSVTSSLPSIQSLVLRLIHLGSIEHAIKCFQSSYNASFLVNIVGVVATLSSSSEENSEASNSSTLFEKSGNFEEILGSESHSSITEKTRDIAKNVATWLKNGENFSSWPLPPLMDLASLSVAEPRDSQPSVSRVNDTFVKSSDSTFPSSQSMQSPSKLHSLTSNATDLLSSSSLKKNFFSQQEADEVEFSNNYDLQGAAVQYLQRRLRMVEDELHEAINSKNVQQSRSEELEQQISKLTDNLQEYRNTVRELKLDLEKSKKKNEDLSKLEVEKVEEIANLKKELTHLAKQQEFGFKFVQEFSNEDLQGKLIEANEKNYKLTQLLKTQKEDADFITNQYQNASTFAAEQSKEVAKLQVECKRLQAINSKVMEEVKVYNDSRVEALLAKVSSLEETLKILEQKSLPKFTPHNQSPRIIDTN